MSLAPLHYDIPGRESILFIEQLQGGNKGGYTCGFGLLTTKRAKVVLKTASRQTHHDTPGV